jgi:putative colanic acid biosynthesis acetyltransferase WcaF
VSLMKTDLSSYHNSWYKPGPVLKRFFWHYVNTIIFKSGLFPFYGLKIFLLRCFGAKVGKGVFIKPFVNIKYPWFLMIGNFVWIGENVWIDNLANVVIGNNVCLSQEVMLITGNHNYSKPGFDLFVKKIIIEDGVWIGAKAVVCPGITCKSHSVLAVGAIATDDLEPYGIYQGNPAKKVRERL